MVIMVKPKVALVILLVVVMQGMLPGAYGHHPRQLSPPVPPPAIVDCHSSECTDLPGVCVRQPDNSDCFVLDQCKELACIFPQMCGYVAGQATCIVANVCNPYVCRSGEVCYASNGKPACIPLTPRDAVTDCPPVTSVEPDVEGSECTAPENGFCALRGPDCTCECDEGYIFTEEETCQAKGLTEIPECPHPCRLEMFCCTIGGSEDCFGRGRVKKALKHMNKLEGCEQCFGAKRVNCLIDLHMDLLKEYFKCNEGEE